MVFEFLKRKTKTADTIPVTPQSPDVNRTRTRDQGKKLSKEKELAEYEAQEAEQKLENPAANFDYLNIKKIDERLNAPKEIGPDNEPMQLKDGLWVPSKFTFDSDEEVARKKALGEEVVYYKATVELGAGAMGSVFKAEPVNEAGEPLSDHETIVVKYSSDEGRYDMKKRLLREIAMEAIMHPAQIIEPKLSQDIRADYRGTRSTLEMDEIPAFHGAVRFESTSGGDVYLIGLEQVEGKTLNNLAWESEKHQLPKGKAIDIMMPVARAIEKMHQRGLIHRDVKPANIMGSLDHPENTRLIDMGIGKDLFQEMTETVDIKLNRYAKNADWLSRQIEGRIKDLESLQKNADYTIQKKQLKYLNEKLEKLYQDRKLDQVEAHVKQMENLYSSFYEEGEKPAPRINGREVVPPSRVTEVGSIVGTAAYMSPEAVTGVDDPNNDWYSAAVTALELTGDIKLSKDEPLMDVMTKIAQRKYVRPIDVNSTEFTKDNPKESEQIFVRAWNEFLKPPLPQAMWGMRTKVQQGSGLNREDLMAIDTMINNVSAGRDYTEAEQRMKKKIEQNRNKKDFDDEIYDDVLDFFQEQKAYFDQHQSVRVEQNPGAYILSQLETAKIAKAREEAQEAAAKVA